MARPRRTLPLPAPFHWPRAEPAALASFDPATKLCTMNCGRSSDDPRSEKERQLLCDDCLPRTALAAPGDLRP